MQGYNIWCKWHPLRSVMLGDAAEYKTHIAGYELLGPA